MSDWITFDRSILNDFSESSEREWLESNGIGGFASGTLAGVNTRRYHGLLVAATQPPLGRFLMLSKLDEALLLGRERHALGTNQYPGAVAPQGFLKTAHFAVAPAFPTFTFESGGVELTKTITAVHGSNTTVIQYEIVKAPTPFTLELKPFIAGRDYHSLRRHNHEFQTASSWRENVFSITPYRDSPTLLLGVSSLGLSGPRTAASKDSSAQNCFFEERAHWYHNFEYLVERSRGYDYLEDLFCPGNFLVQASQGDRIVVLVTTEPELIPPGANPADIGIALIQRERARRESIRAKAPQPTQLAEQLTLAADSFLCRRGSDGLSVIAGYPWFGDWGRDTMISLPGLCFATGRHADAFKILHTFAQHVKDGMIPNRFRDEDGSPEYNTVDASLWFCLAVQLLHETGLYQKQVQEIFYPAVLQIVSCYQRGTHFGIHAAEDGLLTAGDASTQLTWMDAKVGDWVVTPRYGKPVEIQALWINALAATARLAQACRDASSAALLQTASTKAREAFLPLFWNEDRSCLFDCVDDQRRDPAIRPNQLFALSLREPLVDAAKAARILKVVEERLLTPYGMRSLDPRAQEYKPHYRGDHIARDGAYHQGTVWTFLIGPYIDAVRRFGGASGTAQANALLQGFAARLTHNGIGTLSEVADGDAPFTPRGCFAQAWSVAEVLRVLAGVRW